MIQSKVYTPAIVVSNIIPSKVYTPERPGEKHYHIVDGQGLMSTHKQERSPRGTRRVGVTLAVGVSLQHREGSMTHRDARLLARLKEHAAIVRPGLVRQLKLQPNETTPEPCPACDGGGLVFRLRPNPSRAESPPPEPAPMSESAEDRAMSG